MVFRLNDDFLMKENEKVKKDLKKKQINLLKIIFGRPFLLLFYLF